MRGGGFGIWAVGEFALGTLPAYARPTVDPQNPSRLYEFQKVTFQIEFQISNLKSRMQHRLGECKCKSLHSKSAARGLPFLRLPRHHANTSTYLLIAFSHPPCLLYSLFLSEGKGAIKLRELVSLAYSILACYNPIVT